MTPDPTATAPTSPAPTAPAETAAHALEEGVAVVLESKDTGDWARFADWVAQHPDSAGDVARFLADHRKLAGIFGPGVPPPRDRADSAFGGLELREEIGRGAMGVVYRAFDPVLKRDVAVKMVRTGARLSAVELAKFLEEAENLASLNHPNVVPIHSYGEVDGAPYLVMPLMAGSLAKRLRDSGPDRLMNPMKAAELVRDIALGVHHAHQRGLIHRDIKPGNILLDREGVPHVADFGLALPVDATATGIAGAPAYMAPEQARGEKHLTTAVDIHALGVILFELLTGGVPFGAENVSSILRRVAEEPAPPVSQFRPDVPRDLAAICMKCLEKRPEARYTSAQELADDLDRFLRREPVVARPRSWLDDMREAVSRRAEEQPFMVWVGVFFAAVHHPAVHFTIAGLALAGAPAGWMCGVMAYHLLTWFAQMWWFGIRRRGEMNRGERQGMAIHLALWLTMVSLVPLHLAYFGPDVLALYPALNSVSALGLFATSVIISGRVYPAAIVLVGQNLLFLFLPMWSWPILHGLSGGVIFALIGLYLWRVDRAARKSHAAPSPSD